MTDTVLMTRTEPMHEGGPTTAKVHPAEVGNWRKCGWVVVSAAQVVEVQEPAPLAEVVSVKPEPALTKGKPGRKPKYA